MQSFVRYCQILPSTPFHGTGDWTQGLGHVRQMPNQLSYTPTPDDSHSWSNAGGCLLLVFTDGSAMSLVSLVCEEWKHRVFLFIYLRNIYLHLFRILVSHSKNLQFGGWRDGSEVKNICHSCRRPGFSSQNSNHVTQTTDNSIPGPLRAPALTRNTFTSMHTCACTHTHTHFLK